MSSILKALKKLENEPLLQDEVQSLPGNFDPKKAVSKRAKSIWLVNRVLSVLVFAIILTVGAWMVVSHRPFFMRKPPPATNILKSPKEKERAASIPAKKRVDEATTQPTKVKAAPTKPIIHSDKEAPKPVPSKQEAPTPKTPEKHEAFAMESQKTPVIKQPIIARPIDESRFKVEAIVWSNKPESRFAVINGHIVRAGGSVEGMAVTQIGRDYVAVQSGDRGGKLRFKLE